LFLLFTIKQIKEKPACAPAGNTEVTFPIWSNT
jgi:hypothetical protein